MNFVTTRQSLSKLNFSLAAPKFFYLFDYLDILPFLQELKEFSFAGFCHDSAMFKQAYIALAVPESLEFLYKKDLVMGKNKLARL